MSFRMPLPWTIALVATTATAIAGSYREEIEADWRREDERRLALIRTPGTVRFSGAQIDWPGVMPDRRMRIPSSTSPTADGRLDEAVWSRAARVAASNDATSPELLVCHDGRHLWVGTSFPSSMDARFGAHPTSRDAAGAVDGVKNGRYGFHCGHEPNPWWEVDLGAARSLGRLVVYNRQDYAPGLHNADRLVVSTSEDRATWTERWNNGGRHFGGVAGGAPLEVDFAAGANLVRARFVRLSIPSAAPIFFHLDEVEIYPVDEPTRNIALHRTARQSSLSPWSTGGPQGCALLALGARRIGIDGATATVDGNALPASLSCVRRDAGQTTVELAVPLATLRGRDGKSATTDVTIVPPGGAATHLALGGCWRTSLREVSAPGFGRNRWTLDVHASGPIAPPVAIEVEVVVFTPTRPWRRVVLAREFAAAASVPIEVDIACEGPAAIIVTERRGAPAARFRSGRAFFIDPVDETLDRAARLAASFELPPPSKLRELRDRAAELVARERTSGPEPAARAALYREARWHARETAFANPRLGFGRLLFLQRFTQETYPDVCLNHMPWCSRPGGDICVLEQRGAQRGLFTALGAGDAADVIVRPVIDGALGHGHVHGLDLHWDGERIVFGWASAKSAEPPAGWLDRRTSYRLRREEEPTHLWEIRVDGSGLHQLTDGEWSDLDPTYLPSGDIAFASERCGYSLQCNELDKDETSCNLYRMRADGSGIRRLSVTKDGDYLPHAFADGTIGYTRWEYQERGWAHIQSIWTVRPDGTGEDAVFKQHLNDPWALEDMRSISGSTRIAAIATGHHTLAVGPLVLIEPGGGLNDAAGIRIVTPGVLPPEGGMSGRAVATGGVPGRGGFFATPWPLSAEHFLTSFTYGVERDVTGYALYLVDVFGTKELVWRDPAISCFTPIPLRSRPRPPVLPDVTDQRASTAVCVVSDISRGADGISPRDVRFLRISQRLAWPYDNEHGGHRYEPDVKGVMVNWTPVRVIGTVPVEADGSASFVVPADTPLYFQLLDARHMELRRMRSFVSFQPGEVRACAGCHETRAEAPAPRGLPLALRREPVVPVPPPWGRRALSFLRDVQPVLDRACVRCHGGLSPDADLDLSGGLTARHNRAYDAITARGLVARSNVGDDAKVTQPLAFGSRKSRLIAVLDDDVHRDEVELGESDWLRLVTWIDANGPYHDGFIDKRPERPPYDLSADRELLASLEAVHSRRCGSCHAAADVSRLDWIDLHAPRRSPFLNAPLAASVGGAGACGAKPVYADRSDPDYRVLLESIEAAVGEAWSRPRRDLQAFDRGVRIGRR